MADRVNLQGTQGPPEGSVAITTAHVAPFVTFLLCLALPEALSAFVPGEWTDEERWYVAHPNHWIYPLQTVTCVLLLIYFRKHYRFAPHTGWLLATLMGVAGIAIWLAPGWLSRTCDMPEGWWSSLGFAPRTEGFDPSIIEPAGRWWYLAAVAARFVRLVIVVPLVEEIFWRGYLMRFLADSEGDFWQVPFGTFHKRSLIGVTLLFVLAHSAVDYLPATIFGLLMYGVAVRTKSLSACVIMHATANLLLGLYVMQTQQWGYW